MSHIHWNKSKSRLPILQFSSFHCNMLDIIKLVIRFTKMCPYLNIYNCQSIWTFLFLIVPSHPDKCCKWRIIFYCFSHPLNYCLIPVYIYVGMLTFSFFWKIIVCYENDEFFKNDRFKSDHFLKVRFLNGLFPKRSFL